MNDNSTIKTFDRILITKFVHFSIQQIKSFSLLLKEDYLSSGSMCCRSLLEACYQINMPFKYQNNEDDFQKAVKFILKKGTLEFQKNKRSDIQSFLSKLAENNIKIKQTNELYYDFLKNLNFVYGFLCDLGHPNYLFKEDIFKNKFDKIIGNKVSLKNNTICITLGKIKFDGKDNLDIESMRLNNIICIIMKNCCQLMFSSLMNFMQTKV